MNTILGQPRRHFEQIDSTNEAALQWAREGAPHGAIVTAQTQSAGRGRRGRDWVSPPDCGLYLSLILRPQNETGQVAHLTMLAALAASCALEKQTGLRVDVKWPNDVLLRGRKIGGILSEAEFKQGDAASALDFVVVGLGLNINFSAHELPERPIFPASSLLIESGRTWEIETILAACLESLQTLLTDYELGLWDAIRQRFVASCIGIGEAVTVRLENETFQGLATGIDPQGALLVATGSGLRPVLAGDVLFGEG